MLIVNFFSVSSFYKNIFLRMINMNEKSHFRCICAPLRRTRRCVSNGTFTVGPTTRSVLSSHVSYPMSKVATHFWTPPRCSRAPLFQTLIWKTFRTNWTFKMMKRYIDYDITIILHPVFKYSTLICIVIHYILNNVSS